LTRTTNPWLILVLVCMAQFMVILDATIVNVALPTIQTDLGMSAASLQWVVNSYTLIFGGFLLLGGRAGDLVGRKRLFLAGLVIFAVASLLNGLATSSEWLIVARGLQGLGAALISPAALSIVTTTFAEGADRARAMSVWAGIAAGGGAVLNTSQQVGGALGLAILSTLAANKSTAVLSGLNAAPSAAEQASALVDGFHIAFLGGAVFMATGAILLTLMLKRSEVRPSEVQQVDVEEPLEAAA
jgi:MFS family permease